MLNRRLNGVTIKYTLLFKINDCNALAAFVKAARRKRVNVRVLSEELLQAAPECACAAAVYHSYLRQACHIRVVKILVNFHYSIVKILAYDICL